MALPDVSGRVEYSNSICSTVSGDPRSSGGASMAGILDVSAAVRAAPGVHRGIGVVCLYHPTSENSCSETVRKVSDGSAM